MKRDQELTNKLRNRAERLGISVIGLAEPALFEGFKRFHRPEAYMEDVKTVIVIGVHVFDLALDIWCQDTNTNTNYHFMDSVIENRCHEVKEFLKKEGFKSLILPYSPGLFLKDAAALAGIGPIGKNNLLITEKYGSQVRLKAMLTTAPLETGNPVRDLIYCKDCDACIKACPAHALTDQGYDRSACFSYNQSNLKKFTDDSSLWCNKCIEACKHYKAS